jgi:hypothetical protein
MFHWLRRRSGAAKAEPREQVPPSASSATPARDAPPAAKPRPPLHFLDTAPLPEVISEGNTQADWSAWEDSVLSLDSQLQELASSARAPNREAQPRQSEEPDAFARVKARRAR